MAQVPETTFLFYIGPKAKAYADQVQGVKIADAGEGLNGFAQFPITL